MSAPPHGVPYDCRPHRTVRIYRPLVLAYMMCSAMTGASSNGSAPMRHPTLRLGPDCTACGADPRALRCRPPRRQSSRRGGAASLGIFAGVSSHARRAVRRLQYGVATSQAQQADRRARRRRNQLGGGSSCRPPSAGVLLRGDAAPEDDAVLTRPLGRTRWPSWPPPGSYPAGHLDGCKIAFAVAPPRPVDLPWQTEHVTHIGHLFGHLQPVFPRYLHAVGVQSLPSYRRMWLHILCGRDPGHGVPDMPCPFFVRQLGKGRLRKTRARHRNRNTISSVRWP